MDTKKDPHRPPAFCNLSEGRYRKAEAADRCGVCRAGISPGLTFAACGRRTYLFN